MKTNQNRKLYMLNHVAETAETGWMFYKHHSFNGNTKGQQTLGKVKQKNNRICISCAWGYAWITLSQVYTACYIVYKGHKVYSHILKGKSTLRVEC